MARGGAAGISVLTEPSHFNGSLHDFILARDTVSLPLLMKDIIVERSQVETAHCIGADAVLLIKSIFDRGYADCSLEAMIDRVHSRNMEVLLEVHTSEEFRDAEGLDADLIGINNRDLKTLKVDLHTTEAILAGHKNSSTMVVSESGIESQADVLFLRRAGARAFLIGTSVMSAENVGLKVRELVEA
jgi:indole-3-glycerol phosphate synthase